MGTRSSTKASGDKPPEVHGADKPLDPNLKPEHQSRSKLPSIVGTKTPTKSPIKTQTPKRSPRKTISEDPPEEIPIITNVENPMQDFGETDTQNTSNRDKASLKIIFPCKTNQSDVSKKSTFFYF